MSFLDKTAVVTGGCSGIGYATVENFLKQNIKNIAILDLGDPKNVIPSLQNSYKNQNILFIKTDVTKKEEVKSAFAQVAAKFNFIDFVVACAGILRERDYELTINVNLLGLLHTTYTAIEFMNKETGRGGVIVSIASVAGLDGFHSMPAYCATKHAVVGWNRCFGEEFYFNKYGIKFITICPSFTDTAILDDLENRVAEGTLEAALKAKEILPFQTADSVGRNISEIIISGNNGSVWIIDDGKAKEITLNKYYLKQ